MAVNIFSWQPLQYHLFQIHLDLILWKSIKTWYTTRDHFGYEPSHWGRMLQGIVISHWLDTFTKRSLHYQQKLWNIWKAQWRHSYLTFWFAWNDLALIPNKYCAFNTTLICSVMGEKCNLQCLEVKIHNKIYIVMYRFLMLHLKFPRVSMKFFCVFDRSLLASCKICDRTIFADAFSWISNVLYFD